ncbi:MAG: PEGA domain-containing protein [Planctomycetes bacterium]|nr:PEGA domain-containing protein [Planctomycetota bacterium]
MRRTIVLVLAMAGCAMPEGGDTPPPSQQKWYGALEIYSDPPGAHVYTGNTYYGETGENAPVRQIWDAQARSTTGTLTLKKRGYKPTYQTVYIRLDYGSKAEAEQHYQKVVVVLDVE